MTTDAPVLAAGAPGRLVVAAGLVWSASDRIVVQRRSPTARHGAGRLELPGGKVEPGEAPVAALARELGEEWGALAHDLPVGPVAEVLHHRYPAPGPEVLLLVYHVDGAPLPDDLARLRPEPGVVIEAHAVAALPVGEFLAADRGFVERVAGGEIRSPWAGER